MQELDLTARFAAALEAVPEDLRAGPIGIAVSGGSDSMALLHLAHRWARGCGATLRVLTVDHRLRPGSAAEAGQVAAVSGALGLTHQTLQWDGPVPRQAAARRARHALLAHALREAGGRLLLTGHTRDDQAETFLIRARQGSGWYGLACMRRLSLSPVWPEGAGLWIARPLLEETRADLRGFLKGQGTTWSDDPSNSNPAFERVRVRARLSGQTDLQDRILSCQQGFAELRRGEDSALADWLGRDVHVAADGELVVQFDTLAPDRAARGLGVLIQCLAGRETPPRSDPLAALAGRILSGSGFRGATLGGVRLRPGRGSTRLRVEAEIARTAPDMAEIEARLDDFRRLYINSAQETGICSGKESFLKGLVPIFQS